MTRHDDTINSVVVVVVVVVVVLLLLLLLLLLQFCRISVMSLVIFSLGR